jgi:hypothetical protein
MPRTQPVPHDLTQLLSPYPGEWVALSHDEQRVLGHGQTITEALAPVKKEEGRPLLMKVPDKHGFVLI